MGHWQECIHCSVQYRTVMLRLTWRWENEHSYMFRLLLPAYSTPDVFTYYAPLMNFSFSVHTTNFPEDKLTGIALDPYIQVFVSQ